MATKDVDFRHFHTMPTVSSSEKKLQWHESAFEWTSSKCQSFLGYQGDLPSYPGFLRWSSLRSLDIRATILQHSNLSANSCSDIHITELSCGDGVFISKTKHGQWASRERNRSSFVFCKKNDFINRISSTCSERETHLHKYTRTHRQPG